jgi:hypothetical protein
MQPHWQPALPGLDFPKVMPLVRLFLMNRFEPMFHQEQIALTSTALLQALKNLVSGTTPIFMLSCETLQRIYHGED